MPTLDSETAESYQDFLVGEDEKATTAYEVALVNTIKGIFRKKDPCKLAK